MPKLEDGWKLYLSTFRERWKSFRNDEDRQEYLDTILISAWGAGFRDGIACGHDSGMEEGFAEGKTFLTIAEQRKIYRQRNQLYAAIRKKGRR